MNAIRSRIRAASPEAGFSLIEVVVAMVILGVLTTASLGLYITSLNSASTMQRREIAVTIASQQMELVAATPASALYQGRSQAAVLAQWAANLTVTGANQTLSTWDTTVPLASTVAIPLSRSVSLSGTNFTVTTLIGTCFQGIAGTTAGGNCTRGVGPAASLASLERVMVIVRWTAGDTCGDGSCVYETSTLIDTHTDQQWRSRV